MTAAEREQDEARALVAREKAEAARIDAEAKRIESERVRALWAFANGSCPEGYVAVGGADRPDGEPIFIESAKDHIGNYAYYYQIGEYRFMSHGYSDDDRRTLFVPDHLVEGWMTAACGKRGITGESAKAYIEKFKGCYGSAIYEWAAANLPEVA
jgi:hypothetical protein